MALRDALPDGLLDAMAVCVARSGLAATTLEDVAREAGCSRATLYRYASGKAQILGALAARDGEAIVNALVAEAQFAPTLTDAVVAVVAGGVVALGRHPVLARLLADEPDVLLPYLVFGGQAAFEGAAIDAIAQLQVHAGQLAQALELPLRSRNIHHGKALADTGPLQRAGHPQHGHGAGHGAEGVRGDEAIAALIRLG